MAVVSMDSLYNLASGIFQLCVQLFEYDYVIFNVMLKLTLTNIFIVIIL